MKETDELKLNRALNEAIEGKAEGLDFFADFDMTKPPIEKIFAAVHSDDSEDDYDAESEAHETRKTGIRVKIARRKKFRYIGYAATAACFIVMIASVGLARGFDISDIGLADGVNNVADSSAYDETATTESGDVDNEISNSNDYGASEDLAASQESDTASADSETRNAESAQKAKDSDTVDGDAVSDSATPSAEKSEEEVPVNGGSDTLMAPSESTAGDTAYLFAPESEDKGGDPPYGIIALIAGILFIILLLILFAPFLRRIASNIIGGGSHKAQKGKYDGK